MSLSDSAAASIAASDGWSPDEQGNYDIGKNDDFAKRQNRDAVFDLHLFAVTMNS